MNRRDVLRGACVVAAATPSLALAPDTSKIGRIDMNDFLARATPHAPAPAMRPMADKLQNDISHIIGTYLLIAPADRASAREMLRAEDFGDLADALARL